MLLRQIAEIGRWSNQSLDSISSLLNLVTTCGYVREYHYFQELKINIFRNKRPWYVKLPSNNEREKEGETGEIKQIIG